MAEAGILGNPGVAQNVLNTKLNAKSVATGLCCCSCNCIDIGSCSCSWKCESALCVLNGVQEGINLWLKANR